MAEIKVEDAAHGYVETLNRLGVDYVFGSPGSEFIPLWSTSPGTTRRERSPSTSTSGTRAPP